MNRILTSIAIIALIAFAAAPVFAYEKGEAAPDEMTGIEVGEKAPDFTLKDQNGTEHSLSELLKEGRVALMFFRSANWWPYCKAQLVQLQEGNEQLKDAGIKLVGISYDPVETLKSYADDKNITFTLLSDEGSKTIDAFGIRNKAMDGRKFGPNDLSGVPHPGTYILDSQGVVQAKLFLERYQVRHTTEELLKAADSVR